MKKAIIIGAGPAGLTAAYELLVQNAIPTAEGAIKIAIEETDEELRIDAGNDLADAGHQVLRTLIGR